MQGGEALHLFKDSLKKPFACLVYEPCCEKTCFRGLLTRSGINRAVQPQKMARGSKFWGIILSM